jgi:hypothetical protein
MRTISTVTILVLLVCGRIVAEDPPDLPLTVNEQAELDKILDSNLGDAMKAYNAYRAVLAKMADKTIKDLEKEKLDVIKRGNLALASAVVNAIKDVKSGSLRERLLGKVVANDLLGNGRTLADIIVGKKFAFYNSNGFLTNLTMEKGGHIGGSQHRNETFWKTDEDNRTLLFIRDDNVKSSIFTKISEVKGRLVIEGKYQFGDTKHTLKEIE